MNNKNLQYCVITNLSGIQFKKDYKVTVTILVVNKNSAYHGRSLKDTRRTYISFDTEINAEYRENILS